MGQYYKAVVMPPLSTKTEIIAAYVPSTFGMFAKLTEHSWMENDFVQTVESFFRPGEKFYKHRLVWAGDYADPEPGTEDDLYDICEPYEQKRHRFFKVPKSFRYLVNHTKKLYLDKKTMPSNDGWRVHPLPILTCEGNGRGGGDYFYAKSAEEERAVGSWARDVISVEETIPEGYSQLNILFHS